MQNYKNEIIFFFYKIGMITIAQQIWLMLIGLIIIALRLAFATMIDTITII